MSIGLAMFIVVFHYFFVHRYNQERITRPVIRLRFQDAVVKGIRGCGGIG